MPDSREPTLLLYTLNAWESVYPVLRVTGPARQAGWPTWFGNRMGTVHPHLVDRADVVVIQRDFPRLGRPFAEILERARTRHIPVVLDLDDLLLALPEDHPDRQTGYYQGVSRPLMRAILDVDHVIASTPPLQRYLLQYRPDVKMVPNFWDDTLWPLRPPRLGDRPVVIGYIGGRVNTPDLEKISPALEKIARKYGTGVAFHFWGAAPPGNLRQAAQVRHTPLNLYRYADFAAYAAGLHADIFIAPLADHVFNHCKSGIKFLDYSALGVPGVYANVSPYRKLVQPGVNGLLAGSLEEWEAALSRLIENPEERMKLAQAAQDSLEPWRLSRAYSQWKDTYLEIWTASGISAGGTGNKRAARVPMKFSQARLRVEYKLLPPGSRLQKWTARLAQAVRVAWNEGPPGIAIRFQDRFFKQPALPYQPFEYDPKSHPWEKISLVLLTHNQWRYTRLCLESLERWTALSGALQGNEPGSPPPAPPVELVVVDNCSTDGTRAHLLRLAERLPQVRLLFNDENKGFAESLNQGIAAATGDLLVLLNNDIIVTPGWLERLGACAADPRVGMVNPVTNSAGNASCIPVEYENLDALVPWAQARAARFAGRAFLLDMVQFHCVALRRQVLDQVGMLDTAFGRGYFEDDDYSYRVRQVGYQLICVEDAFVHHWGSASLTALARKQYSALYRRNQRYFEKKWGLRWRPRHHYEEQPSPLE